MENIKNNLINYLKKYNMYSDKDFVISEHNDIYFSKKKFCNLAKFYEIEKENIKLINDREYIYIGHAYNYLLGMKNYEIIDMLELFELVKIKCFKGLKIVLPIKLKMSGQLMFTYTFHQFLLSNYPTYTMKIEEDFLKRYNNIIIGYTRGPRVDIIIENLDLIIEFDELLHQNYNNVVQDNLRDKLIRSFGHEIIRFKEGNNIFDFFDNLKNVIKEREFLLDSSKFSDYVIDLFVKEGYAKNMVSLLVKEEIQDIVNRVPFKEIGMTPKSITLKKTLYEWLNFDESENINYLIEKLNYPYLEEGEDIILSPKAFGELINFLDAEKHIRVLRIRKFYIDMKIKLLEVIYNNNLKLQEKRKEQIDCNYILINNSYERGLKDSYTKNKELIKKYNLLEERYNFVNKIMDDSLPKNNRGFIKKAIINKPDINSKIIIPEFPQLKYSDSENYISLNQLNELYNLNKKEYKISVSFKKCVEILKEKLDLVGNTNSLINNYLFGCEIVINKMSQENNDNEDNEDL